jgi:hypothetical protein
MPWLGLGVTAASCVALLMSVVCLPCACVQVVKIERIQHAKLWRRFALRRSELVEARGRDGEGHCLPPLELHLHRYSCVLCCSQ